VGGAGVATAVILLGKALALIVVSVPIVAVLMTYPVWVVLAAVWLLRTFEAWFPLW
jgi:hypothetical protein